MSALVAGLAAGVVVYVLLDEARLVAQGRRLDRMLLGRPGRRWELPDVAALARRALAGELPLRVIQVAFMLVLALFAAGLVLRSFLFVFAAALLAVVALYAWSQRGRWTLAARVEGQLPAAMHVMANALSAGGTLFQALERSVEETPAPLGELLRAAVNRCRVNQTVEESLDQLRRESGSRDVAHVVAALAIQRVTGGNLAKLLRESAEFLREEQRLRADARALSAQARYSAQMIGAMPVALFALFLSFFPDYIRPLTDTPLGLVILSYCGISVASGFYFIWRIATAIERGP